LTKMASAVILINSIFSGNSLSVTN
jgi:hypothetical protein